LQELIQADDLGAHRVKKQNSLPGWQSFEYMALEVHL